MKKMTGAEIRQGFIDFFIKKGHTFVPSSSLVPGGDQTLLFTNAGMVQFKDVFLGVDKRDYSRAVNSQKCMRVAGKHNDLDDVGRDDSHHTFFEMLGNWSFGDYYKKEAIAWAWELLTEVWGLNPDLLYATVFKDDKGEIPADEEAASYWQQQKGMNPEHILSFGRKDNFWEMADTGPCGPCSEIHMDRGDAFCKKKDIPGHVCRVNGDCARFLEIWNLVFIQYNRVDQNRFDPLPARHVDTGMGFDRIVAIIQDVNSNYRTDLFSPMMDKIREIAGKTAAEMDADFTPYRVIADHTRAAAFLIADGVVPGNIGRNYVCRMIIRRAARFASKLGLNEPFMAQVANVVIDQYGAAYPELEKNRKTILDNLTREEKRFQRTVEGGVNHLEELLDEMRKNGKTVLDGSKAFDLYATHGLPLEITRDIAREINLEVDESGFKKAMGEHKLSSGAGKALGVMAGDQVELYRKAYSSLVEKGKIPASGVKYDPYHDLEIDSEIVGLFSEGEMLTEALTGSEVEVILPKTGFYIEAGGQVSDTGTLSAPDGSWEIRIEDVRRPAAGIIIHIGEVVKGTVRSGDMGILRVDRQRRMDVMRNHTATHLLHAQLHKVLGSHARQAGSLVAPDRLRFDFTHPDALTQDQLEAIEGGVNEEILASHHLLVKEKPLQEAMAEGAMALFGEKYGEKVRTVTIDEETPISYELCGGTHVDDTGDIGTFLIINEGSAAAGIRRIEAVTGRGAYEVIQARNKILRRAARLTNSSMEDVVAKINTLQDEIESLHLELTRVRQEWVKAEFEEKFATIQFIADIPVLSVFLKGADIESMRQMTDIFRQKHPSGIVAIGSVINDKPMIICAVTEDLVKRGINAGEIARHAAGIVGGSGGGRPVMAQAGGKDPARLPEALSSIIELLKQKLQ
ncbi:MAG TPA: alanine--tRNA ligase [Anaerolineaceae bacterium]|nr:alanine--tRNA ligase [Anaerolineaceae bacterium]